MLWVWGGHCTLHAPGEGRSSCPSTCAKLDPPPDLVAANVVRAADQKKELKDYPISTQKMIFRVTYFLELRNATSTYFISHILPTSVKSVVWTL